MRTLMVWCPTCGDQFDLEVDANWNDGPVGSPYGQGWVFYLPDAVPCPDCETDCVAEAHRAAEREAAGPSAEDLADMRAGV